MRRLLRALFCLPAGVVLPHLSFPDNYCFPSNYFCPLCDGDPVVSATFSVPLADNRVR